MTMRADHVTEVQAFGESMGELFTRVFELVGHENIFVSCYNCSYWQEGDNVPTGCMFYKQLPPVKVIVTGCPEHVDKSQIPF